MGRTTDVNRVWKERFCVPEKEITSEDTPEKRVKPRTRAPNLHSTADV